MARATRLVAGGTTVVRVADLSSSPRPAPHSAAASYQSSLGASYLIP
ncbi:MAG: hypothetical protein QOH05_20 [Acetobacteraceae bacterium]|jgi:hypothetical protein|nr:hypothetical protein [Acetobacteraceae bacterium]